MVILFLGVLHNYIITIVYQQSREQKRVGANSPRSPLQFSAVKLKITMGNEKNIELSSHTKISEGLKKI